MPPKKAKAAGSSQQELRQTRGGRKRRHSDASNASDRPSSSHSTAAAESTPSKRRKRGTAAAEADHQLLQIEEEEDELAYITEGAEATGLAEVSSARHVRFGGNELQSEVLDGPVASTKPHPQKKMASKHRTTASPGLTGNGSNGKRVKRTSIRHSLPAALSQEDSGYIVEEREFAPLHEVLQERVERRSRMHGLTAQIAAHRDQGHTQVVKELENELAGLRQEQGDALAIVEHEDDDVLDNNMLVLARQEEILYPDLPHSLAHNDEDADRKLLRETTSEELSLSQSQMRSKEESWRLERAKFEDLILALSKEASESKTKLQILEIEIKGLGFGRDDIDPATVLTSIRESFASVREKMESTGLVPAEASNEDMIEILMTKVKDMLVTGDQELKEQSVLVTELGKQIHDLIDHLADAEIRKQQLEELWGQLDRSNEEKAREIEDLQEALAEVETERDRLIDDLEAKTTEEQSLRVENDEFTATIDRLKASLIDYRTEESRLQELISRMEEEYSTSVGKMNREREETVRDLEDRLDEQNQGRSRAEQLLEERQGAITDLELRIGTIETERDALLVELGDVKAQRDEQEDARETAESGLQDKAEEVEDLNARVDRLEDELADMKLQIEELRQINESERGQREAAEADLDDRNVEIDELNEKLHEQGMEANELRQKLFEVQQVNERKVKELETLASEREVQYQTDIALEVDRRDSAEETVQEHAATILELEARIEEIEQEMKASLVERDERIQDLQADILEKDDEMESLRNDVKNAEDLYDAQVAQSDKQVEELESSLVELRGTIAEHEKQFTVLREEAVQISELHDSETEDRNARIAELNHTVMGLQNELTELDSEKASLERRVEQEAEQMLELQNEKSDEIDSLKAIIHDKQDKIQNVEEKAVETDRRWQEVLEARDEEIALLRTTASENAETITTLSSNFESLKRLFHNYVRFADSKMLETQTSATAFMAQVEERRGELEAEGESALEEIDAMVSPQEVTIVTSTSKAVQEMQTPTVKKTRGRKKRVIDSGIGIDGEEASPVVS